MNNHRDDDILGNLSLSARSPTPDDYVLTSFSEDWGAELSGAFCIGRPEDIKLLESFCSEHGFAICESTAVPLREVRSRLRFLFSRCPRGYLVVGFTPAEAGLRLLRLTQVVVLGGKILRYMVSAPNGAYRRLKPSWPLQYQDLSDEDLFKK